jgi:hypothetical protein
MAYRVEVTDTFGGDANYSWVRRYTIANPSQDYRGRGHRLSLVRRAKAIAGWQGLRCEVSDFGDELHIRPVGRSAPCWIMFVSYDDTPEPDNASLT